MCMKSFFLGAIFAELLIAYLLWGMTPQDNVRGGTEYEYTVVQDC